ncbi:unnamed protein product [Chondrus crispus]|uniref:Uncharacterized protein n=1 Tax=Chondrus crispus TaxID=2769 RepID=R7QG75_CHOCR|nr:unnamed protein product [Chondrus crispus]CDF36783.1 unnamed protein product [Chondrus crispus]|eukprot:XP_005716602.1 unnamed protein product [Chondrus crispus]
MARRLGVIEKLRKLLGSEGIPCPGIVVVGAQSSGKSSVLERLTDIAFPRDTNTCTRVPIIVQLQRDASVTLPTATICGDEHFETDVINCSTKQDITNAIHDLTEKALVSTRSRVVDKPIHIRYVRSKGPVMTLIDLPGITHDDGEGRDIHGITADIVKKYLKYENMIALVVIPANDDFGNSEALKIAKTFDTTGARTLGVISKCDLVPEQHSDIVEKIQMTPSNAIKLGLGYIAIRNKGPGDDLANIDNIETELFKTHPLLKNLAPHERGCGALRRKIISLQENSIKHAIPRIQTDVRHKIEQLSGEISAMGTDLDSDMDRNAFVSKHLSEINQSLQKLIRAEVRGNPSINVASRSYELYKMYAADVRHYFPDCLSKEYGAELQQESREFMGFSLQNFTNDQMFRQLLQNIFFADNFSNKTDRLIDDVGDLMARAMRTLIEEKEELTRLPNLAAMFHDKLGESIDAAQTRARDVTMAVIKAESKQVFALDKSYMEHIRSVRAEAQADKEEGEEDLQGRNQGPFFPNSMRPGALNLGRRGPTSQMNGEIDSAAQNDSQHEGDAGREALLELQISLHCYGETIMRRLFDVIPMLVQSCLVYEDYKGAIEKRLAEEDWDKLFEEDPCVAQARVWRQQRLNLLRKAYSELRRLS